MARLLAILGIALSAAITTTTVLADPAPYAQRDLTPQQGMLLVARRDMPDPRFHQTVILVAAHDASGSLGLVVNRATPATLEDLLPELAGDSDPPPTVYFGGPVQLANLTLLIHQSEPPEHALNIRKDLYISGSEATLRQQLKSNQGPKGFRLYLGYAGWDAGQLAQEISRGDWHLQKPSIDLIFSQQPERLWDRLIEQHDPAGIRVEATDPLRHLLGHLLATNIMP